MNAVQLAVNTLQPILLKTLNNLIEHSKPRPLFGVSYDLHQAAIKLQAEFQKVTQDISTANFDEFCYAGLDFTEEYKKLKLLSRIQKSQLAKDMVADLEKDEVALHNYVGAFILLVGMLNNDSKINSSARHAPQAWKDTANGLIYIASLTCKRLAL